MMEATLEQKKKKKLDYSGIIGWGKDELKKNEDGYLKRKEQIINEMADKLSKIEGIERQKISMILCKELKGIVGATWIREKLPPEYKTEYRSKNASKRKSSNTSVAKQAQIPETEDLEIWETDSWDVDAFDIKDLDHYSIVYCRKIIKNLDEKNDYFEGRIKYWDDRFTTELTAKDKEIEKLKAEIAQLRGVK